jgi:hypothetical protein
MNSLRMGQSMVLIDRNKIVLEIPATYCFRGQDKALSNNIL